MKKILILYTAVGQGHKVIAENMGDHLKRCGYQVSLFDAYKLEEGITTKKSEKIFLTLYRKFPFIWKWLYVTEWFISLTLPLRVIAAQLHHKKILEVIRQEEPDIILTTQTSPSAVVDYLKRSGKFSGKFVIAFSDFHLHRFWLYGTADYYLANTEEQKQQMIRLGVAKDKIFVCGITLAPKSVIDELKVRQRLGIMEGQKVVVLASGSLGERMPTHLITVLKKVTSGGQGVKVVIVCGKNKNLLSELQHQYKGDNQVQVLGFYQPMQELYAVADCLVSKPGGLTVTESLFWEVPLFVTHYLPGQEELNIEYLEERKLVQLVMDSKQTYLSEILAAELKSGALKKMLRENSHKQTLVSVSSGEAVVKAFEVIGQ